MLKKRIKILIIIPTLKTSLIKKNVFERDKYSFVELNFCVFQNNAKTLSLKKSILQSNINIGFTGAINSVLLSNYQEDYDWFLILNDDAELKPDFFQKLKPFLSKKQYDVVSCGVEDRYGEPESFGLSYKKNGLAFPITDPQNIDNQVFCGTAFFISKACVRRHITQDGYFFHPLYFAYAEDLEVSLRMKKANEKIYIHPESIVIHQGSQTAKRGSEFQLYQGYRNLLLTLFFHWSFQKIVFSIPWLIYGQLYCVLVTFKNRRFKVYPRIVWYFMKNFQALLFERAKYHSKPNTHSKPWKMTVAS